MAADTKEGVFFGGWSSLAHTLKKILSDTLARYARVAYWTSLQVNADTVATPHVDVGCKGLSLILLSGAFSRGAFVSEDGKLETPGEILVFRGERPHSSEEFSGTRFSIIFHTVDAGSLTSDQLAQLRDAGFSPSPPPADGLLAFRFL